MIRIDFVPHWRCVGCGAKWSVTRERNGAVAMEYTLTELMKELAAEGHDILAEDGEAGV